MPDRFPGRFPIEGFRGRTRHVWNDESPPLTRQDIDGLTMDGDTRWVEFSCANEANKNEHALGVAYSKEDGAVHIYCHECEKKLVRIQVAGARAS